MDKHENVMAQRAIENAQYRYQLLIKSLEAKAQRVEPNSVEFENIIAAIFEAKDKIAELERRRVTIALASADTLTPANTNA